MSQPERRPSIAKMLAENRGPRQGTLVWAPIPPAVVSNATPGPTGLTFHVREVGPARESPNESACLRFEMDAVVDFRTADGLLDETWRTAIRVTEQNLPILIVDFQAMPLRGRLQVDGLGPKISFFGAWLELGAGGSGQIHAFITRSDGVSERKVLATWVAPPPAGP